MASITAEIATSNTATVAASAVTPVMIQFVNRS